MKQLLIETHLFTPGKLKLSEGLGKNKNLIVEGILATAEVENGNGRYYKKSLWERELDKYMESVNENRAMGELDHPDSQIINLKNVSHNIVKAWWDGNHIMGEIEILPTPSGNILKALIESNIAVGVSSRGMGSLEEKDDLMEVQDDFELLCWDFVSMPSNPGSWMNKKTSLREGKQPINITTYVNINKVITEILCANGQCPIV